MRKKVFTAISALLIGSTASAVQVYPRIFTPNGDGFNDKVVVELDNPGLLPLRGEIFDITGAKVEDMRPGPKLDVSLMWDGRQGSDRVPGGIYIYQIELGQQTMTGTVVVAE